MQLSTMRRAWILVGALVGCGTGGDGTVTVLGGPSGPFSVSGSPGPFSGQGSPGAFSPPDSDCAALCARLVALQCPPPRNQGGGSSTTLTPNPGCAQACTAGRAGLKTDCERNLYTAFLSCLLGARLYCGIAGGVPIPSPCEVPLSSACTPGGQSTTTGGGPPGGAGGG
jgi:hypothetical protein